MGGPPISELFASSNPYFHDLSLFAKNENTLKSKKFIETISSEYYKGVDFSQDKTHNILDTSIITHRNSWDNETEKKLSTILRRYKETNN